MNARRNHSTPSSSRPQRTSSSALRAAAALGLFTGILLTTVLMAPASLLATLAAHLSQERLWLSDTRGSLWQGSAAIALTGGRGSSAPTMLPGRVHWSLAWHDGPALHVRLSCCMQQEALLKARSQAGGWQLGVQGTDPQGLVSVLPAHLLRGLGTPWNTLDLGGQLRLRTQGLELHWNEGRLRVLGEATLELQQARSRLSTLHTLGDYRIEIRPQDSDGSSLSVSVSSQPASALRVEGTGQWSPASGLRFRGEASAAEGREQTLDNLLNIMGRRDGARSLVSIG